MRLRWWAVALLLAALVPLVPFMREAGAANLFPVTQPVKQWPGRDGKPLNMGYIYFGTADQNPETSPIQMYWDVAGTIPAPQPFRTLNGYIVRPGPGGTPANVYANSDFSVTVKESDGTRVFTQLRSVDLQLALAITGVGTAAAIPIADAGGYYTTDNVEAALQQVATPGFTTLAKLAGSDVLPYLAPTGAVLDYVGTSAPTGWLLMSGLTIGNASSNATARANADTATLFTLLWNSYGNTELPIVDSAGSATTRGASAANDYAANKALPLPDCRGRARVGKDNMGGSTASRITNAGAGIVGTTMGASGGTQTHALTATELTDHTHTASQGTHNHTQDAHAHALTDAHVHSYQLPALVNLTLGGASAVNAGAAAGTNTGGTTGTLSVNNQTATNQAASAGAITVSAASASAAHQNTQPSIIFNVIIKLRCVPRGVDGLMVPVN